VRTSPLEPLTICLVGCGKSKLDRAAPAKDLYTGSLFRAARAFAEQTVSRIKELIFPLHGL